MICGKDEKLNLPHTWYACANLDLGHYNTCILKSSLTSDSQHSIPHFDLCFFKQILVFGVQTLLGYFCTIILSTVFIKYTLVLQYGPAHKMLRNSFGMEVAPL